MARTAKRYMEVSTDTSLLPVTKYLVGIYSRLSVDHNNRKSESIENQIEIIRQYIDNMNLNNKNEKFIIYDTYIDLGISGTLFERTGFDRLRNDVRNQVVNCIIVKDLSRFGRDYLETGNYIEKILPFLGVRFIAVTDGFDSMAENVSDTKLVMNIKNLVNEMYAKDISVKVMTARKIATENGSYIGSFAPYGYVVTKSNGIRKLCIHRQNAEIVRCLFKSYASGIRLKEIVANLYKEKVHRISDYNKYGHTFCKDSEILHQWNPSVVRGVLSNPVYCGKSAKCNSDPIVEQKLFEKVNTTLSQNKYKITDVEIVNYDENIFRNIIYCKNCNKKMKSTCYKSKINGKKSYSYYCKQAYYIDGRKCSKNYIREDYLESIILDQIKKLLNDETLNINKLTVINQLESKKKIDIYSIEQRKIMKEQEKIIVRAGTMYMQYREDCISMEEYRNFMNYKLECEQFCKKRLEELEIKIQKCKLCTEKENEYIRSLKEVSGSRKLNIYLVEALIDKITVSPEKIIDINYCFNSGGEVDDKR